MNKKGRALNSSRFRASTLVGLTALTLTAAFTSAQNAQISMTEEEKIQDALSAGPDSATRGATLLEWPSEPGGDFRVLREGTNSWSSPAAMLAGLQDPTGEDETWFA